MKKIATPLLSLALTLCLALSACAQWNVSPSGQSAQTISLEEVPEFSGEPYVELEGNVPGFDLEDLPETSFESYSPLDELGRCGPAVANIGTDLMPTEERGEIGQVKPSGWHTVRYDIVDGKYLYNRCHLIGYQLTGENANEENLITGTRYLNVEGMLPFENQVAQYIQETGNHVLYRVTPIFSGTELVARGVQMEAYSVEDQGQGVCFNVYVYNCQPGITIDYATGDSYLTEEAPNTSSQEPSDSAVDGNTGGAAAAEESAGEDGAGTSAPDSNEAAGADSGGTANTASGQTNDGAGKDTGENTYILNTNTMKFHYPDCSSAAAIKEGNREIYTGSREDLIAQGYAPCGQCKP